jgi:hypothetical protein
MEQDEAQTKRERRTEMNTPNNESEDAVKSLIAAIEGNEAEMRKEDLVVTCEMLRAGRERWRKEAEEWKSVAEKLWGLLDDIDTASDMFKPEMQAYEKYVCAKAEERHKLLSSDGYTLWMTGGQKREALFEEGQIRPPMRFNASPGANVGAVEGRTP